MKMAFLVICPGSSQYDERREGKRREETNVGERLQRGGTQRGIGQVRNRKRSFCKTSCPFPSSLSFLISLKERRSVESKCTVILTPAKVSRDISVHTPFPAGHFGTGQVTLLRIDVQGEIGDA